MAFTPKEIADMGEALLRAQREAKNTWQPKPWYLGIDIYTVFGGGSVGGKTYAQEHGARQGFDLELTATEIQDPLPALPKPKP